jgi:hypothetical protein
MKKQCYQGLKLENALFFFLGLRLTFLRALIIIPSIHVFSCAFYALLSFKWFCPYDSYKEGWQ